MLWNISQAYGHYFSAWFRICIAAVNMFMSLSCHVRRFVELLAECRNASRSSKNLLVLIQLGALCKDLIIW